MTEPIRHRIAAVNGVELAVLEAGNPGTPPIVLSHGFPESAWSWRHQLPTLAAAGYHVIAPDQRGYGGSSCPTEVAAYGIDALCDDLLGLVDETGHDQAVFVGHDWGALIVWDLARLHPERVRAVAGVSVPFTFWPARPTEFLRAVMGDRFFYILYFQEVGPAERGARGRPAHHAVDHPVGRFRRGLRAARVAPGRGHGLPHGRFRAAGAAVAVAVGGRPRPLRRRLRAGRASSARSATTATSTPTTTGCHRCRPRA